MNLIDDYHFLLMKHLRSLDYSQGPYSHEWLKNMAHFLMNKLQTLIKILTIQHG